MIQVFGKQEVVEWWIWKRITQYSWLISSLKPNFRNPGSVVPEKNVTKNIHGTDGLTDRQTEGQTEVKQYTPFFSKRGYKNQGESIMGEQPQVLGRTWNMSNGHYITIPNSKMKTFSHCRFLFIPALLNHLFELPVVYPRVFINIHSSLVLVVLLNWLKQVLLLLTIGGVLLFKTRHNLYLSSV